MLTENDYTDKRPAAMCTDICGHVSVEVVSAALDRARHLASIRCASVEGQIARFGDFKKRALGASLEVLTSSVQRKG